MGDCSGELDCDCVWDFERFSYSDDIFVTPEDTVDWENYCFSSVTM